MVCPVVGIDYVRAVCLSGGLDHPSGSAVVADHLPVIAACRGSPRPGQVLVRRGRVSALGTWAYAVAVLTQTFVADSCLWAVALVGQRAVVGPAAQP